MSSIETTSDQRGLDLFRHVDSPKLSAKLFVASPEARLTYGALRDLIARTARLFANSGIDRGDRIVICSNHEVEAICLYLAAMRVGVTPALIDSNASPSERVALVRAARAKALFADEVGVVRDSDLEPGGRLFQVSRGGPYTDSGLMRAA